MNPEGYIGISLNPRGPISMCIGMTLIRCAVSVSVKFVGSTPEDIDMK